jgi:hypothetical protein
MPPSRNMTGGRQLIAGPINYIIYHDKHTTIFTNNNHSFETRPGPAGRPGSVAGPGLSKKQARNWPGETRSTRRVDPGPGRPGQTRLRPGFYIYIYIYIYICD